MRVETTFPAEVYTIPIVDMYTGDHMNKMRFAVADMPAGKVNGYLPMSWLKDHNPDINWEQGSLKWRSEYCKPTAKGWKGA